MPNFKTTQSILALTTSLLAMSLEANYATNATARDTTNPRAFTKRLQAAPTPSTHNYEQTTGHRHTLDGKPRRLLSGSVAYGSQYWSYAKVDWMEPIWQSRGKQLYTSLDYMNHLHKSNSHSHEIGSGLVLWQPLASGTEIGMGAYWLNYNSWHNLRHHGLRLGAKVIWQDWQVTGNGFLRISKAKQGKPAQIKHSYFGTGVFGSEVLVNGLDLILERTFSPLEVQMLAYHYPQDANQNPQLLTTGAGVQIRAHPDTLTKNVVLVLEAKHDQAKRWLYMIGLRTRHATHHHIGKTDTDLNHKSMDKSSGEPCQQIRNTIANFLDYLKNNKDQLSSYPSMRNEFETAISTKQSQLNTCVSNEELARRQEEEQAEQREEQAEQRAEQAEQRAEEQRDK